MMALSPFLCRHCTYKAVAGLAGGFRAQHGAEPGAGTLLSCLAPLCTLTHFSIRPTKPRATQVCGELVPPRQDQDRSSLSERFS